MICEYCGCEIEKSPCKYCGAEVIDNISKAVRNIVRSYNYKIPIKRF